MATRRTSRIYVFAHEKGWIATVTVCCYDRNPSTKKRRRDVGSERMLTLSEVSSLSPTSRTAKPPYQP
jgi:hypothetical protein